MYGTAMDFVYEVNKQGATEQSIRTEMLGSMAGSSINTVIEGISLKFPVFNGTTKIFTNTILSDEASEKTKEIYNKKDSESK